MRKCLLKLFVLGKCLVTLWTIVLLVPTVGLPVFGKATSICKCLRTQVTRLSICHFLFSPPLLQSLWWLVTINAKINYIGWNTFPFTKKGWLGWKLNFHSWKGMISTKGESYSQSGLATWPFYSWKHKLHLFRQAKSAWLWDSFFRQGSHKRPRLFIRPQQICTFQKNLVCRPKMIMIQLR